MDKKKLRIKGSGIAGTLGAILAGTALFTISGSARQGTLVQQYEAGAPPAEYTVMVYMNGSDLEEDCGAATADITEMIRALDGMKEDPPSLNLVVEMGGAASWQLPQMQGEGHEYSRFRLTDQGVEDMEYMSLRNMGEPETLTDFINFASQTYPASHYGLVLWNHGAGPVEGYGSDSNFDGDSLTLSELRQAVSTSFRGQEGFDFVSFDACLMGGIETAACLDGMADYVIASPELEPQDGLDYGWLTVFGDEEFGKTEPVGKMAGEAILDSYENWYQEKGQDVPVTMTLIDMEVYDSFHEAFHPFLAALPPDQREELFEKLGRERQSLRVFGSRRADTFSEMVDLMDLMDACRMVPEQDALYMELQDAVKRLAADTAASGKMEDTSGLSIYLPSGSNVQLEEDMGIYEHAGFCSAYQELMMDYAAYLAYDEEIFWENVENGKDGTVCLEISPEELTEVAGAYLAVFCDSGKGTDYYMLSTDSDVEIRADGKLQAVPEKSYPGLKGEILCLIETINLESYTEYMAPILYNGRLCTMEISFDDEHEDGEIRSIVPVENSRQGTKEVYTLKEGDRICPLYPFAAMEEASETSQTENMPADAEIDLDKHYYRGKEIVMETPEDMRLELVEPETDRCVYGYMLVDLRQKIYFTEFTEP